MKWIKASERLPEYNKNMNGRITDKLGVHPGIVRNSNLTKGYLTFNGNLEKLEDVEWLDESEPVSNPMIEGEVIFNPMMILDVYGKFNKWVKELTQDEIEGICDMMQTYHDQFQSQPIVKGEGKWSDEDMEAAYNKGVIVQSKNDNEFDFQEWLEKRETWIDKPTPFPEKQEEILKNGFRRNENGDIEYIPNDCA